jgi:hypothetical protein
MTLVVARIQGDRIAIASDTRISKGEIPLPVDQGVIKTCIINRRICVAFSNSPELAERDILAFADNTKAQSGFAEAISFFERASKDSGNDYIVAFARPPRLVKIANGERVGGISKTMWIGDEDAYHAFREYDRNRRAKAERGRAINAVLFADEMLGSPASDLYSTMRHIVADRSIPSVGDFIAVVSNRPEGFRYSVYSDMLYDWPAGESEDYLLSLSDKLQLGASDENAEYSVAQFSPGFIGANPVAFYFIRGHCLYAFFGANNNPANRCRAIRNVRPELVEQALRDLLGFDWNWLALVTSAPPSTGGPRLSDTMPSNYGLGMSFICRLNTMPKPAAK